MADSQQENADSGCQSKNDVGDSTVSEITPSESELMMVDPDENLTDLLEEPTDDQLVENSEETKEVETADATIKPKEDFVGDVLELSGENTFTEGIIDETAVDNDEDEEESKENHEGDGEHDEPMEEDDEEVEEDDDAHGLSSQDPNVMPQVNIAVLAQRKWQVKVYPIKPSDFTNGRISRVFKHARESLLYLLSPGRNARGKGEMYVSSANQAVRCVHSLMQLEYFFPEVNVEIIKKNDEGVVEEKAYLRFDSKLTQILTMRPPRRLPGAGRKKDRLIGSVFLKNLPPGTTKDTLRVMFPFVQEINYNPEKFKDCTARLVLNYRSHVTTCLKAFAKVELGGNVLELHPLTKRKRTHDEDNLGVTEAKQRKKSEEVKKEGPSSKKGEESKNDVKKSTADKNDAKSGESKEKKAGAGATNKDANSFQNRRPKIPPPKFAGQRRETVHRREAGNQYSRLSQPVGKERSFSFSSQRGKPSSLRGNKARQDRSPASSIHSFRDDRSRDFRPATRRFTNSTNRNSRPRGSAGGGPVGNSRGGRHHQGSLAGTRSVYNARSGLPMGTSTTTQDAMAVNTEATKEMVLLQNQLSMAIKNQLAMLNQTTLAVEQAKREQLQSSMMSRTSPKGLGQTSGGSSSRRSVDQYMPATSSLDDGLDRNYGQLRARAKQPVPRPGGSTASYGNKRQTTGRGRGTGSYTSKRSSPRGRGSGGYVNKRQTGGYRHDVGDEWDRETTSSQFHDPYSSDYTYERPASGYGSSTRSYNEDSGYSNYF